MAEIICAGNALKEVMSADAALAALEAGVAGAGKRVGGSFVISDGGDGFLNACGRGHDFARYEVECNGPLGDPVVASYLFDENNKRAYIEIADCCGLSQVEESRRNIMISGTAGVADVFAAAREVGAIEIIIGLGGSATCDGGIGFLWHLADLAGQCRNGSPEPRVALDMPELSSPDIPAIRKWLGSISIIACADVDNPLRGPEGAARVFAPQKGANEEQTEKLEAWMGEWCERIERNAGVELCGLKGAGSAGGLGFAVAAIGGQLTPGARFVCDLTGLTRAVTPDSILLTTEGKFDMTSFHGKTPWEAAVIAGEKGSRAVVFCGVADPEALRKAEGKGVTVIEFGRGLPDDQLAELSPQKLIKAVIEYLSNSTGVSV